MKQSAQAIKLDKLTEDERKVILEGDMIPAIRVLRTHVPILDLAGAKRAVEKIRSGDVILQAGLEPCHVCRGIGFVDRVGLAEPSEDCTSEGCYRLRRGYQLMAKHLGKLVPASALHDFERTSGDCLCAGCGLEYRLHPCVPGEEWMTMLCNAKKVKL